MLNDYLEITSSEIFKHGGTLDKFIGDATMAFWGAPIAQPDMVYKAACAAQAIAKRGRDMEGELRKKYDTTVSFGIGLHCGEAVVGNIGTAKRVDYTAIGNTVNTAARLESNAKAGQILISETVFHALEGRIYAQRLGNIPLKGKSEELMVYELYSVW
jgi:adenylate cyclase